MTYGYELPRLPRRRRRKSDSGFVFLCCLAVLAVFIIGALGISAYKGSEREVVTLVREKDRVCKGGQSVCDYLLFTDAGTFKVDDTFLYGRFDTSDVYGRISPMHQYRMKVVGWRVGFFSMYPNVLTAERIIEPQERPA